MFQKLLKKARLNIKMTKQSTHLRDADEKSNSLWDNWLAGEMKCFRCDSSSLKLAALFPYERKEYEKADIVLRVCLNCGLEQNHRGLDEPLTAARAAMSAPDKEIV